MPLIPTGPVLGLSLSAAVGAVDLAGVAAWVGVGTAICAWIPLNATIQPGLLVATGAGPVTGLGSIGIADASTFGIALAAGAGSVDAEGIKRWTKVGKAIAKHLVDFGQVVPTSFATVPITGGPVTGVGTILIPNPLLGVALAEAVEATDPPGILLWTAVGLVIIAHLVANTIASATGMASPPAGALTGSGTLL